MSDLRQDVETIYRAALNAVRADSAVGAHLRVDADGLLQVSDQHVDIGSDGVYAIAIGKAAVGMIDAAAAALGEHFTEGIAVSKSEPLSNDQRVTVMYGAHPVPDASSLAAGSVVLEFAAAVPAGALVLCLVSGGGSSLVESLRDGIELDRLREVTSALLRGGASIHELNAVRSRMSRIKAGGLLAALAHARVHNLIVSDVLTDDPRTIASGPCVPASNVDAETVVQRYGISGTILELPERPVEPFPPTTVIANLTIALDAARAEAARIGYTPVTLSRSLDGEAREAGRLLAAVMADSAERRTSFGSRTCLLAGGETTVWVRGSGTGGRNTEAALAAAIRLSGVDDVAMGFLATDGDDGTTGAAGAVVDGATVSPERRVDASRALAENDSYPFLRDAGSVVVTGPTGTNVNDLVIGLLG
jgi:glycerate 2-kinase